VALTRTLTRAADKIIAGTGAALSGRATAGAAAAAAAAAALMITCGGAALAATPAAAPASTAASGVTVNCAASPHACGYPDATSTGVPAAMPLLSVPGQVSSGQGWKYDPRGWVEVYGSGAVLSGLYIPCNLDISASNVTISNVTVVTTGNSFGISLRHTQNAVIENSAIYSPYASGPGRLQAGIKDVYGDSTGTTVRHDNIWHVENGVQLSAGTITDNYIHNLAYTTGDHVNGIDSNAGTPAGLTVVHNTVFNPLDQTDAITLFENFGPQFNATISDNLLAGGGYTVYGGANPGKWTPSNIVITGNRFARTYYPKGGYYGPVANLAAGVNGNTWSGNVWDDTGSPVSP
jgi:hypothetical protein